MTEATVPAVRSAPRPRMAGVLLVVVPLVAMSGFIVGIATGVRGDKVLMLFLGIITGIVTFIPMAIDQMRAPENRHLMLTLLSMAYLAVFAVPAFAIYLPATGPVEPAGMTFTAVSASDVITGQLMALGDEHRGLGPRRDRLPPLDDVLEDGGELALLEALGGLDGAVHDSSQLDPAVAHVYGDEVGTAHARV